MTFGKRRAPDRAPDTAPDERKQRGPRVVYVHEQPIGQISTLPNQQVQFRPADRAPYIFVGFVASDLRKAIERLAPLGATRIGSGY